MRKVKRPMTYLWIHLIYPSQNVEISFRPILRAPRLRDLNIVWTIFGKPIWSISTLHSKFEIWEDFISKRLASLDGCSSDTNQGLSSTTLNLSTLKKILQAVDLLLVHHRDAVEADLNHGYWLSNTSTISKMLLNDEQAIDSTVPSKYLYINHLPVHSFDDSNSLRWWKILRSKGF